MGLFSCSLFIISIFPGPLLYNFDMWNIRMRASKSVGSQGSGVRGQTAEGGSKDLEPEEMHISGAEGIYEEADVPVIVKKYIKRALAHPRGRPDKVMITLEEIKQKPKSVRLLPVTTLKCSSSAEAMEIIFKVLMQAGISKKAVNNAIKVLTSKKTMRGAALITAGSGIRLEQDKDRGIRVTRLGIGKASEKRLSRSLSTIRLNSATVKEALVLASKVVSCPGVLAEICISDDPDYITGYVASKKLGYLRIPNIKNYGEMHGGRVFFISDDADVEVLIEYLEKKPVLIDDKRAF